MRLMETATLPISMFIHLLFDALLPPLPPSPPVSNPIVNLPWHFPAPSSPLPPFQIFTNLTFQFNQNACSFSVLKDTDQSNSKDPDRTLSPFS